MYANSNIHLSIYLSIYLSDSALDVPEYAVHCTSPMWQARMQLSPAVQKLLLEQGPGQQMGACFLQPDVIEEPGTYVCTYTDMNTCSHVRIYIYICIYICRCIYIYLCMCINICIQP